MDTQRVERLLENIQRDSGGAFISGLGYIGDRLEIFAALAENGPVSSTRLAEVTALNERYLREWLKAMAAFGYVSFDAGENTYRLDSEQRAVLVDPASAVFAAGTFQFTIPSLMHTPEILDAFRNGGGIAYGDLHPEIPEAIDRMHRAWFEHLLTAQWIPDVPGLDHALRKGVSVLDVGCGLGRSTVAMAGSYPATRVLGIDPHRPSIDRARRLARQRGVDNAEFADCTLQELPPGQHFDVIAAFDCIHDMADPVGALTTIHDCLSPDGLFLWSEPAGSENPLDNTSPLPRLRAALSIYHCLTVSLAQDGAGLGTILGEEVARNLAAEAGFTSFETFPVRSEAQLFFGLRR
jgi:2-polyprenyl-3-methyl-5-hydroxy-6-metoxy-1,4-benzoquinol methylase